MVPQPAELPGGALHCSSSTPPACRLTSEDEREGQAAPEQPGLNLPGVALSRQAGQPAEDVVLFCGIIDFLQVCVCVCVVCVDFPRVCARDRTCVFERFPAGV